MNGDRPNAKGANGDDLHQLLREVSGAAPAARPGGARTAPPTPAHAADDLQALLKEGQGAGQTVKLQAPRREPGTAESLASLLNASTRAPGATAPRPSPPAGVNRTAGPTLDQALKALHGEPRGVTTSGTRPAAAKTARADPLDLGQALRDQDTPIPVQVAGARTDVLASPWFVRVIGIVGLGVVLGAAFWWHQPPSAGPAGTLQALAQAVEQYRQANHGQLPVQLSKLGAFPHDAVEWPAQYWSARDAAGRVEIVWIPQGGGHYSIAHRQGNAIWVYSEREGKSRQASPGK